MTAPDDYLAAKPSSKTHPCPQCGSAMINAVTESVCPGCGHTVARPKVVAALRRRRRRAIAAGAIVALSVVALVILGVVMALRAQTPTGGIVSGIATIRSPATSGEPQTFEPAECLGDGRLKLAPFYGVGLFSAPPHHIALIVGRRIGTLGSLALPTPREPFVHIWQRPQQGGSWTRTELEPNSCRRFEVEVDRDKRPHDPEEHRYDGHVDLDCEVSGVAIVARIEFSACRRDRSLGVRSLE